MSFGNWNVIPYPKVDPKMSRAGGSPELAVEGAGDGSLSLCKTSRILSGDSVGSLSRASWATRPHMSGVSGRGLKGRSGVIDGGEWGGRIAGVVSPSWGTGGAAAISGKRSVVSVSGDSGPWGPESDTG